MICSNCHQPTDDGAVFCGNCGQPLQAPAAAQPPSPIAQVMNNQPPPGNLQPPKLPAVATGTSGTATSLPAYALAKPGQHSGETKALLSVILGVAGIVGALFFIPMGLAFGIAGLVMGTMSHSSSKRGLSTAGLVFSSLAILVSLGFWTYAVRHDPRFSQTNSSKAASGVTAPAAAASSISTPCYTADFVNELNVSNNADSCDMNAYNGKTIDSSSNVYKVYADTSQIVTAQTFTGVFKAALEKDVKSNLPGFTIDSEQSATFAGSPAYIINTSEKSQDVAVVEAAVLHPVGSGENVFILVHAVNGQTADLTTLEAQWQWK